MQNSTSDLFIMGDLMNNYTTDFGGKGPLKRNNSFFNNYKYNSGGTQNIQSLTTNNNFTVRRSNTLNNSNRMNKKTSTYIQSYFNTPTSKQYPPVRNHTINVSSMRKYSKINTYENFQSLQMINRTTNFNNRINQLTPLQIQRNKMKSSFVFPNGEKFTPKNIHLPIESISKQSSNTTTTTTTSPKENPIQRPDTQSNSKKKKKSGSFWKKLVGKDSNKTKITSSTKITEPSLLIPTRHNNITTEQPYKSQPLSLKIVPSTNNRQDNFDSSKLIERLKKYWDVVNVDSSISILNDPIIHSYMSTENVKVSFANEIFVNDTYSPEEYHRADPENITKQERKMVFDNEFGFIDEVKYELNQYKRKEMLIHHDSIQFVQFSR